MSLSFQDAFKVVAAAILSVGGGGVIVVGLSSWLGKLWAQLLMQKDIAKYAADLESLKGKLEGANKRIQAELDKTVYVHRVQFETEFKALSGIWAKVAAVRSALAEFRPQLEIVAPDHENDLVPADKLEKKLAKFVNVCGEFRLVVHEYNPVYPKDIYDELERLIDLLTDEEEQIKLTDEKPFTGIWFKHGE